MEDHGDFSSVSPALKPVMSHPETERTKRGRLSPAFEVLLICGEWMSHYKVEAWRSIIQHCLGWALVLASGSTTWARRITIRRSVYLGEAVLFCAVRVLGKKATNIMLVVVKTVMGSIKRKRKEASSLGG